MLAKKATSVLLVTIILCSTCLLPMKSDAAISFIILSRYRATVHIGEEFRIIAIPTTARVPKFKSANSSIASVNTYGLVTPKKPGTVKITAKISGAEASCLVTVLKTELSLNSTKIAMERGFNFQLTAKVTPNRTVTYKSNRKSIITVDDDGLLTANKPGTAIVTAKADTTEVLCRITVKKPVITLSNQSISLYRLKKYQLQAHTSSGYPVVFSCNRSSVADINESGLITANKHGKAIISAKLDGVIAKCTVNVQSPRIKLTPRSLTLNLRKTKKITADVSSGNVPVWTTSNSRVAIVKQNGQVTARKKGTAFIYASEDGTKVKLKVTVK